VVFVSRKKVEISSLNKTPSPSTPSAETEPAETGIMTASEKP